MAATAVDSGDWQRITHGGLRFAMPADWQNFKERKDEGQWGIRDQAKREGVLFRIDRTRRPERQLDAARRDGLEVEQLARVEFAGLGGDRYRIAGEDKELGRIESRLVVLDSRLPNGDRVTYQAVAVSRVDAAVLGTIERLIASVEPTGELISLLTGSSRQPVFDGAISVEVRNNWKRSDHYSDAMKWSPPGFSLWGEELIAFLKGWGLTGRNGLLSELADASIEATELFGSAGWRISGTGAAFVYADVARTRQLPATTTVFVSGTCLGPGEPFGYAISGTESQLAEYEEAVNAVIGSIELNLPDTAGPCDEPLPYQWKKGLTIEVPRSWRRDANDNIQFSFFGRDILAAAYTQLHAYHDISEEHPVEGHDSVERLAALTIDGYPATHFRRIHVASNGDQSQYDTFVLDTRMRYRQGRPTFLSLRFSSSPPAADALSALQRGILGSVRLDGDWSSEVPVQREQPSTAPQAAAAAGQVPATDGAPRQTVTSVDGREPAGPPTSPSADGPDRPPEPTPGADTRQADDMGPRGGTDDSAVNEPSVDAEATTTPAAAETGQTAAGSRHDGADAAEARRMDYEAARALRDEGAGLQQQGDLRGAVERYRQSLEKYPDKRLEAYIQQLEALLQPQR